MLEVHAKETALPLKAVENREEKLPTGYVSTVALEKSNGEVAASLLVGLTKSFLKENANALMDSLDLAKIVSSNVESMKNIKMETVNANTDS